MEKPVLTIDTASPYCSVALHDGVSSPLSEVSEGEGNHFEQLSRLVTTLLSKASISMTEVGAIGVGVGPGSFTGIRIGMSFAKGAAWANELPLVGFCSLAACGAYALSQSQQECRVAVIADAGRDELFLGIFGRSSKEGEASSSVPITTIFHPAIVPRKDLPNHLNGALMVASPQEALLYSSPLNEVLPKSVSLVSVREPAVGAIGVADFGAAALKKGGLGAIQLEPVYLRQVAAKTIAERLAEAGGK
jgi:tRNA threonylcarbamoyl adenosine modification protein YeaZ